MSSRKIRHGVPSGLREAERRRKRRRASLPRLLNYGLWAAQGLLAMVFLFTGGLKLSAPLADLSGQLSLPGWFIRFLGVAETLGGVGLVLPSVARIRPWLTPLAAAGLVVIMAGATVITLRGPQPALALGPLLLGLLCAGVAYARWKVAPIAARHGAE